MSHKVIHATDNTLVKAAERAIDDLNAWVEQSGSAIRIEKIESQPVQFETTALGPGQPSLWTVLVYIEIADFMSAFFGEIEDVINLGSERTN